MAAREFDETWLAVQGFAQVFDHVDVGQQRCDIGKLGQRGQPQPLQEQLRGGERHRAGVVVGAGLGDQAARQQGAHHRIHVDPADRAHPRARHGLAVGDHRQRLQRGPGEFGPRTVEQQLLDIGREPGPGVHSPALAGLAQVDAAVACGEFLGEYLELRGHPVDGLLDSRGKRFDGHRGVDHQQQRLQHRAEFLGIQRRDLGNIRDAAVDIEVGQVITHSFVSHFYQGFVGRPFPGPRNLEHAKRL